jgi:hypothetical protein
MNRCRGLLGLRYWSLSKAVKMKVKTACKFIGAFEETLAEEARRRGLDGVICGHIHKAEARRDENGYYYNCGDWVESCTALVEHDDGKLQLLDGLAFVEQLREQEESLKKAIAAGQAPRGKTSSLAMPSESVESAAGAVVV